MPDLIVTDVRAALCKLAVETADLNIARNAEELAECDDEILAAICHSLFATIARPADAEVEGLVERVAKALHGRFYVVVTGTDDCHDWPYMPEELRESYRQGAREVIAILSSGPVAAETEHRLSGEETGWLIEHASGSRSSDGSVTPEPAIAIDIDGNPYRVRALGYQPRTTYSNAASVTPELADAAARLRNAGWIWSDDPTVEDIIGEAINCCMDRDEQEPDYEDFERRRDAAVARATKHLASLSTDRIAEGLSPDAARLLETMLKSWETMGWSDHWDKLVAEIRQWIARRPPLPPPPVADIEGKE